MINLDVIVNKIIEDAENEAGTIVDDAKKQYDEIVNNTKIKAENDFREAISKNKREAEEHFKRMISMAQLDMKKETLSLKQEIIDKVFEEACNRLINMDKFEYKKYLFNLLLSSDLRGEACIELSKKDVDELSDFVNEANEFLKENKKQLNLVLSEKHFENDGGFVLISEGVEENYRVKTLVEEKREELETDVISILFE